MARQVKDMTNGSPAKLMLSFALPLMLGNIFQQMYTMTDTAIVGQAAGVNALSALGSADWLCWLVFGVITSIMHGFTIPVAQRFGAGDIKGLKRCVSTIICLSAMTAVGFTVFGLTCTRPLLKLLNTRAELLDQATDYLLILFGGAVITTLYNLLASLLRALGNSKAPLYAMVASSAVNIALDLLFVWGFKWDVAGAAVATLIAQTVAAIVCLISVSKVDVLKLENSEFVFDKIDAKLLVRLAAPMAMLSGMISVGGMAVQWVINGLGFEYVAGFTATNKLYGIMEFAAVSFGNAVMTFTGQNLGARKTDRIKRGMTSFVIIGIITSVIITVMLFFIGKLCLSLFIEKNASPEVTIVAWKYLRIMACGLSVLYLLYIYRSALQGIGDTVVPMISGFAECAARLGVALLLTHLMGSEGIYWAEPAAWTAAMVILCASWYIKASKLDDSIR